MKYFLLVLFTIPTLCFAQDSTLHKIFPAKDGRIIYEKVIEVDSTSKLILFTRAKQWALSHYKSQKDVLQIDDKEAGLLAYKGFFEQSFLHLNQYPASHQYWNTLQILVKDNKAKITITDISIKSKYRGIGLDNEDIPVMNLERYIYELEHPDTSMDKKAGKYRGQVVKMREENKKQSIKNFIEAKFIFLSTIRSIENSLTTEANADF